MYPFAGLYLLITDLRNALYRNGYKPSRRFPLPVISVGNIAVGGTGKTPHVEYLIRLLKGDFPVATLSRGYGRKTRGYILADARSDAAQIGDEPMQYYRKYGREVRVAVGEKRALAIPRILETHPDTRVILLDDAFQHRAVSPSLNILLTDYNRPFYRDYGLPAGRLRERRSGAQRADIIIVSKCPPDLTTERAAAIEARVRKYCRAEVPVFFTAIRYASPVAFGKAAGSFSGPVLLVSGLANAQPLETYVRQTYGLYRHLDYPDHHNFTPADLKKIRDTWQQGNARAVLVTEKDYVKLIQPDLMRLAPELPWFYLPIQVHFLFGQGILFDEKVRRAAVWLAN